MLVPPFSREGFLAEVELDVVFHVTVYMMERKMVLRDKETYPTVHSQQVVETGFELRYTSKPHSLSHGEFLE